MDAEEQKGAVVLAAMRAVNRRCIEVMECLQTFHEVIDGREDQEAAVAVLGRFDEVIDGLIEAVEHYDAVAQAASEPPGPLVS